MMTAFEKVMKLAESYRDQLFCEFMEIDTPTEKIIIVTVSGSEEFITDDPDTVNLAKEKISALEKFSKARCERSDIFYHYFQGGTIKVGFDY